MRSECQRASWQSGLSPIIRQGGIAGSARSQFPCGGHGNWLCQQSCEDFLLRLAPRRCGAIFCARWRKRASPGGPVCRFATPASRKPSFFRHSRARMGWACRHVGAAGRGGCVRAICRRRKAANWPAKRRTQATRRAKKNVHHRRLRSSQKGKGGNKPLARREARGA